jgi:hypothetical protein
MPTLDEIRIEWPVMSYGSARAARMRATSADR